MVDLAYLDYIRDAHRERIDRINRSAWQYEVSDSAESPMNAAPTMMRVRRRLGTALSRAGERLGGQTLGPDRTKELSTRGRSVAGGG